MEFSINNAGGADSKASFNAQLFLDSNSDGKFSTTNEGIDANKIKIYCDGTIVNPVMGDNGKYMYSLNAGNYNYKLVYDLPNGYVGVMPWQLRVSQATNSYRYDRNPDMCMSKIQKAVLQKSRFFRLIQSWSIMRALGEILICRRRRMIAIQSFINYLVK